MIIQEKNLKTISLMYIIIPVIIFLFGWTRLYISIPTIAISIFIFIKNRKREQTNKFTININKSGIASVIGLALLWCFLGGNGKVFYQPTYFYDHIVRNSILKDLILEPWPIMYNYTTYLSYYIGHWMVPAMIGKIFYFVTGNANLSCLIGNILLYFWNVIGVILIFIWIIKILNADKVKKILFALLLFIFFSGLDVIGEYIKGGTMQFKQLLLTGFEWWSRELWQYSSFTSLIFWVYNQAIVPIIIFLMLYNEENARTKMYLLVYGLFFGPYASLGICLYFLVRDLIIYSTSLKEYFTIENILVILVILPIIILYYMSNNKVAYGEIISDNCFDIRAYLLFVTIEFLIYIILIFRNKNKVDLFLITVFLLLFPIIGTGDFVMRTSIPFILLLYIYIAKFIMDKSSNKLKKVILCILLVISALNPLSEMFGGIYKTVKEGKVITAEEINILELPEEFKNNYTSVYNSTFFKYIGKKGKYEKNI